MRKKVIVIGAGLGGMAAAIRLALLGLNVEIWEKNDEPGGKVKEWRQDGFRWDMGPSLLTIPHILENLFRTAGARLEDFLQLERLHSSCRYFWSDGTVIDEDAAFWNQPEVEKFLELGRGIYELSGEAFLHYRPADFWRAFHFKNLGKLKHLPKVLNFQTLAEKVNDVFESPYLRQVFNRFATYNGSSPYRTPSTAAIIPFVESEFGGWHVRGGMFQIAVALEKLAKKCGVQISYETTVNRYENGVVTAENGRKEKIDYLICNADCLTAQQTFLLPLISPKEKEKLEKTELSSSALLFFFGVKKQYPQLGRHNIFFSDHYKEEFESIFGKRQLPASPTIYISISSRMDGQDAPPGCDNYFVLVNAPSILREDQWSEKAMQSYRNVVINHLEKMGLVDLEKNIITEKVFTPRSFASRDLACQGALYGWASHSKRSAFLRPSMRSKKDRKVFFVGGTTHPGGGIPLVLLSGKIVSEIIEREL